MLQTFADQAVIAIENVRLFTELQTSNRELTTALDTQTATSDILRVISRSQTDVQPVFEAIVASAVRLLGAYSGALTRIDGRSDRARRDHEHRRRRRRRHEGVLPTIARIRAGRTPRPFAIARRSISPTPRPIPDCREAARAIARARGYRSQAVVPLLRHDEAVGTISVDPPRTRRVH